MSAVIDFHSHILPGIDDGSKNTDQSLAMLQMQWQQGIREIVATPHFYPQHDRLESFLERRKESEAALREKIRGIPNIPQLHIGAEVHYFRGISDCEELPLLTIDGGQYILVEMPHGIWTEEMYHQLERIHTKRNLYPIIAHIDRYLGIFRAAKLLQRLEELPVLIQANAEFFLERKREKTAMRMLQDGKIHLLGSDCHNLNDRKPNLSEALQKIEKRLGASGMETIRKFENLVLADENRISHTIV